MRRQDIDFIIEHPCPQCAAPLKLAETQRYITCDFCRASTYLFFVAGQRFVIPGNLPPEADAVFVPYWRFKGVFYACLESGISHRFVDLSRIGIDHTDLPHTLGLRGQTQVLRLVDPEADQVTYLKETLTARSVMDDFQKRLEFKAFKQSFWKAYIGDTLSRIFLPFYGASDRINRRRHLYDGILNTPLFPIEKETADYFSDVQTIRPPTGVRFISGICPNCAADLESDTNSLVLICRSCQHVWQPTKNGLISMKFGMLPGGSDDSTYLPIWRIKADVSEISLSSVGDFMTLANMPVVRTKKMDTTPFYFWCIGVKLRPPHFINTSLHISMAQPQEEILPVLPDKAVIHPVTLPLSEAVESLKLMLATAMKPIRTYGPLLDEIRITPRKVRLVYLPFRTGHHDLINAPYRVSVNRAMLHHARNL